MKSLRSPFGGYTIVETMIYLAVTSALFLTAAILISGQQAKTEFNQMIREVESYLSDINNDISTGYYPSTDRSCREVGGVPTLGAPGSSALGTNGDCLFLGRLLHFAPGGNRQEIQTHTIVGTRLNSSGDSSTSLADSNARIFASELVDTKEFSDVMSFESARYNNGSSNTAAFGFVSTLSTFSTIDESGSAIARALLVPATSVGGQDAAGLEIAFNNSTLENPGKTVLCINSNASRSRALITIDQGVNTGGVSTVINEGLNCADPWT